MSEFLQSVPPEEGTRRIIERSAAYPAIPLEDAIQFVTDLYKNFPGTHPIKRADAAAVLKQPGSGIHRPMAACAHYGLLERVKDEYKISELFKTIKNSISEKEKKKALLLAFGTPKLYAEIINRHDGHVVPPELRTHLIRFHRIAEKAADEVAEIFNKNAKYVDVVTEHNILQYKQLMVKYSDDSFQFAEVITPPPSEPASPYKAEIEIQDQTPPVQQHPTLLLNQINDEEKVRVPLTERKVAYIIYPASIKKVDIEILRKQLDVLELLAE